MSDCAACRRLQGLAPKAVKKNYKQSYKNYAARFKPVPVPALPVPEVPPEAAIVQDAEVTLY